MNTKKRNIVLEDDIVDESCREDFEFVEKGELEELEKYKDFLEEAVMMEKADLLGMPTPKYEMSISEKNVKDEEKEKNLIHSDPYMRSSYMAIDEALEKCTDESSEELSRILRRLFLP